MNKPVKQHLIDPEICIRCYTCENTCPVQAIEHDDNNVVVNADLCNFCMDCIPVCPTGSIDEWRVVQTPYSLDQQYEFDELPEQEDIALPASGDADAEDGAALTDDPSHDVRHIILDPGALPFPVLEGQTIGIIPPGQDAAGKPHLPRLYSVSSPRDGERPGYHNISLTVKREPEGVASSYLCDLAPGAEVAVTGPFGSTFVMPNAPEAKMLLICTGTGSAPMRAFTMQRQRAGATGGMTMFFGARTPQSLPYFGPLKKVPQNVLSQHLVFSRSDDTPKEYVQDRMLAEGDAVAALLGDPLTHVYVCGLKDMETGVEAAFADIAKSMGQDWPALRDTLRAEGRYHVETY